jgi:hypothetical protein
MTAPFENRRPRLAKGGRRIDMHCVISSDAMTVLEAIGNGNRSAAIEYLVNQYIADTRSKALAQAEV